MAFILENIGFIWKGPRPISLPPNMLPTGTVFTSGVSEVRDVHVEQFIVILFTVPVLLGLMWLVPRTRSTGRRCGRRPRTQRRRRDDGYRRQPHDLVHVPHRGGLAGAAGVIFTLYHDDPVQHRLPLGLIAFTAAVLGGIGNLTGAVLGGLLIGFIQAYNEGLTWHAPGGMDPLDRLRHPDPHPRLPTTGLLGEQTPEGV